MEYIGFRRIKSWTCKACGVCCFEFKPRLRKEEYEKIERSYPGRCRWDGKSYYILKTKWRSCCFLVKNRCFLQSVGLKPLSCRLWPFVPKLEPVYKDSDFAKISFRGKEYYIYVNTFCPGINKGEKEKYPELILEVFKIWLFPETPQFNLTSKPTQKV